MAFCESWQFRAKKLCYTAIIESVEQRFGAFFRAAVAQLAEPPPCKRRVVRSMRTGGPISRDPVTGTTQAHGGPKILGISCFGRHRELRAFTSPRPFGRRPRKAAFCFERW